MWHAQNTLEKREFAGDVGSGESRWYACYTRARHEKRVRAALEQRGLEVFLPVVPRERQWHDRTRTVHFPLFPGYVFSRFAANRLHYILGTPGVVTVVQFAGELKPLDDQEIENIRRFVDAIAETGVVPEPTPLVEVEEGQRVRVTSGPFNEVEGVVTERRGKDRVALQLGLTAIGEAVRIEVPVKSLKVLERR